MIRKKIFLLLICFAVLSGNCVQAKAASQESLQNQINSNNEKIDDLKDQQQQVQNDKANQKDELEKIQEQLDQKSSVLKDSQAKVDSYQTQIDSLQSKISQVQGEINKVTDDIKLTEEEITKNQKEQEEKKELLGQRLRNTYKNNMEDEFISVILSSGDFADFVTKVTNIVKIVEIDNKLINEVKKLEDDLNKKQQVLSDKKEELDNEKKQVLDKQNELKATNKQLVEERDKHKAQLKELGDLEYKKTVAIGNLNAKEKDLNEKVGDLTSYNENLQSQINDMFKQINTNSSSNSSSSSDNSGQATSSGFIRPASGGVTDPFGPRINPVTKKSGFHTGADLGAPYGESIKAAKSGTVVRAEWNVAFGNMVVIDHGNGVQTLYGHSSKYIVSVGQKVTQGQTIAYVGSTGWSTGPHLHFEIRINGNPVNPMNYIR